MQGVQGSYLMNDMEWRKTLWWFLKSFLAVVFLTTARVYMVLFIRSLLPVMSSSKQNSRWCSWHPGNSVESCNGAAALQQLQLWSHKSELNRRESGVKLEDMCYLSGIVSSCILAVNLLKKNSSDLYLQSAFLFYLHFYIAFKVLTQNPLMYQSGPQIW